jgi:hypothetical protein
VKEAGAEDAAGGGDDGEEMDPALIDNEKALPMLLVAANAIKVGYGCFCRRDECVLECVWQCQHQQLLSLVNLAKAVEDAAGGGDDGEEMDPALIDNEKALLMLLVAAIAIKVGCAWLYASVMRVCICLAVSASAAAEPIGFGRGSDGCCWRLWRGDGPGTDR